MVLGSLEKNALCKRKRKWFADCLTKLFILRQQRKANVVVTVNRYVSCDSHSSGILLWQPNREHKPKLCEFCQKQHESNSNWLWLELGTANKVGRQNAMQHLWFKAFKNWLLAIKPWRVTTRQWCVQVKTS